jgi:hypothetical protein
MCLPPMAARDVGIVHIRLLVGRNSKGSHGHKYHAKSILPLLLLLVSTFYELASGIDLKSKSIAIGHHQEAISHASLIHPSRRFPRHPNYNICRCNMWRTITERSHMFPILVCHSYDSPFSNNQRSIMAALLPHAVAGWTELALFCAISTARSFH